MGKKSSPTIGYKYFMTLFMGVARGPLDEVCQIKMGDRTGFTGSLSDSAERTESSVFAPDDIFSLYLFESRVFDGQMVNAGDIMFALTQNQDGSGATIYVPAPASGRIITISAPSSGTPIVPGMLLATMQTGGHYIDEPDLFGGTNGEGGIQGDLYVCPGYRTQGANAFLQGLIGRPIPSFRGLFTLIFDGMITAMNPYPKKWEMRARRTEKGWLKDQECWYPEKCTIWVDINGERTSSGLFRTGNGDLNKIMSMNPAHMIMECLTNSDWGRGLPMELIDSYSFKRAADTLWDERFGLCIRWNRQDTLDSFVQEIIDHISAALYPARDTGLITLKLIRDDYDPEQVPLLTYDSGMLEISEVRTTSATSAVNEIIVTYTDPLTNDKRQTRVQNLAALQSAGSLYSDTRDYYGVPTSSLANRLAQRDLRTQAPGLRRITLKVDRRFWNIPPAGVFRLTDEFRGLGNLVMRVGKIEDGQFDDGKIQVTAVQDVFTMPLTSFIAPQNPDWSPPDPEPKPATFVPFEVPYAMLRGTLSDADFAQVNQMSAFLGVGAAKPNETAINYKVASRAAGEFNFEVRGGGNFAATGNIEGPLE